MYLITFFTGVRYFSQPQLLIHIAELLILFYTSLFQRTHLFNKDCRPVSVAESH